MRSGGANDIFIIARLSFQVVDRLITNFHLPKSTLLMLVFSLCRLRQHPRRLYACGCRALPLLQLRRRDAAERAADAA